MKAGGGGPGAHAGGGRMVPTCWLLLPSRLPSLIFGSCTAGRSLRRPHSTRRLRNRPDVVAAARWFGGMPRSHPNEPPPVQDCLGVVAAAGVGATRWRQADPLVVARRLVATPTACAT